MTEYNPKAWERLGNDWDNKTGKDWNKAKQLVVDWILELKDEINSVLDAGCNTGYYLDKLRNGGYNGMYYGFDITPNLVERADEMHLQDKQVVFFVGDIMEQRHRDVTLSFSVGVLQHIPDHAKAISELLRVSNKYVIISCYGIAGNNRTLSRPDAGFLNFYYNKQDLLEHIVGTEWELVKEDFYERNYPLGHWSFMFKRKEGE